MATDDFFRARLDSMIDMRRTIKRQRTMLGALMRDAQRGLKAISQGVAEHEPTAVTIAELMKWLGRAERIRTQERHSKHKLYALHAPEVECIGKGKARKPYEFGVKVSLAVTHKLGLMVGARTFPGNPYDGHTLAEQLGQTNTLLQDIGVKPATAVVDLGYRGVDAVCAPVQIIHRGRFKSLSKQQRRWLKRRQAIEPAIGHTQSDHRMGRWCCVRPGSTSAGCCGRSPPGGWQPFFWACRSWRTTWQASRRPQGSSIAALCASPNR